jgi:hypothetical protein
LSWGDLGGLEAIESDIGTPHRHRTHACRQEAREEMHARRGNKAGALHSIWGARATN